jgi:hypothetical protein
MVWRGPDRDVLYEGNEFSLRVPEHEQQVRLPLCEAENYQRENMSSVSYYDNAPILQESISENVPNNEFSILYI